MGRPDLRPIGRTFSIISNILSDKTKIPNQSSHHHCHHHKGYWPICGQNAQSDRLHQHRYEARTQSAWKTIWIAVLLNALLTTALQSILEDLNLLDLEIIFSELEQGHIGAFPWTLIFR